MAVRLKTPAEIRKMRDSGKLVAEVFALLGERVRPGVATSELDAFVEREIRKRRAIPSFKGYGQPPFPASICVAVNEQIVHGIPSRYQILREGDIIGIDIGALYNGYHGDACVTYAVGEISPQARRLLEVTERCLWLGIEQVGPGKRIGDIGHAIQSYAEGLGYGVVRGLGGHGVGRKLHEDGPSVQHAADPNTGDRMRPGLTFTIEPMINQGSHEWRELSDGWTVVTTDGKWSAQFEHTVAVTPHGVEILTRLD